ncbi:hypothetical protein JQS43_05090 [Natronosporangium hydrolyticum]|uniref:Uncharacterized protein n=1 Tax=Natronosporangium hydrolyticum TaxID=2811111 RepID=A0A895YLZ8_9ACTN|nr:hypothetical protein [Natronosporangium hydrolyticum]QSB15716.1 hypothetical protein JQS43_05090 [Natronosporangium hydrolyticum]
MASETVPTLVAAGAMVAGGSLGGWQLWRCWTGRTRRWVRRPGETVLVLTWGPFGVLLLLGTGVFILLGEPVGVAVGGVFCVAGFVLLVPGLLYQFFRPGWWGPRWFRELPAAARTPDVSDAITAVGVAFGARPEPASETIAAGQAVAFGPQVGRWRATFIDDPDAQAPAHALAIPGGVSGVLTLYRGGLVFAADRWEDQLRRAPTVLAVPLAEVGGGRVASAGAGPDGLRRRAKSRVRRARLVIGTGRGDLVFETGAARRIAARVAELIGGRVW